MRSDKLKTSVTLSKDILTWIDAKIGEKHFASRSHAVEFCLTRIREDEARYLPKPGVED